MLRTLIWGAILCHAGCALTSNAPPLEIRYFSPPVASTPVVGARTGGRLLELGRVTPSSHLRFQIVYRTSPVEVGLYDALRWAERPETYVRRAVIHELFEVRSMVEAVGGSAPTLDIEVLAFEEVRRGMRHSGRVQLRYQLEGPTAVLASGVITVERDAPNARIESVVQAIGAALAAASSQLADVVAARLRPVARPDEGTPPIT